MTSALGGGKCLLEGRAKIRGSTWCSRAFLAPRTPAAPTAFSKESTGSQLCALLSVTAPYGTGDGG